MALAGLMFLASCSSKTEYTHALPKDASVVVALELDEMARKAGLDSSEGKPVVNKLKGFLKGGLQGDAAQLAERIIDKPSESGLSFDEKVYLFATPHAQAFAVLAKVEDEGKMEALLEMLQKESIATPLKEESECRWTKIGTAICGFNNGTFLLVQPAKGDADGMKGTLFSWMRQQEGEGYASLPEFERLKEDGNDLASTLNLTVIPYELTTTLRMGLSADIRLEDIKYLLTANFEHPAEIVCKGKRLVNAVLRKVQEPTLDVGESYNYQTLYSKGENIAQKYLWYKTQSTFADIMKLDFKIITDKYQEMLGLKNNSNNFKIPTIEKTDLEIIKRIENEFPLPECTKVPFYYIIYQKKPDTNVFTANLRFLFLQYWARKKAGMDLPPAPWKTFNARPRFSRDVRCTNKSVKPSSKAKYRAFS